MRYSPFLFISLAQAAEHIVRVGRHGSTVFDPETLQAAPGDSVTYHFYSPTLAVVQSSSDRPCDPLTGGFYSGRANVGEEGEESPVTFTIVVNNTDPIWAYSGNPQSCLVGAVHSINPVSKNNNRVESLKRLAGRAVSLPSNLDRPVGGQRKLQIQVGGGKDPTNPTGSLRFRPENAEGQPEGTLVQFIFNQGNHSVVQSAFNDPCQPLENGFSSGFVPKTSTTPEVIFTVLLMNTSSIWFYDAQPQGSYCQKGMVGSINGIESSGELTLYKVSASRASMSTVPPQAPLHGLISVDGNFGASFQGPELALRALNDTALSYVPPLGAATNPLIVGNAGGGPITTYGWGSALSNNAANLLQLIQVVDNTVLETLSTGQDKIQGGQWDRIYPDAVVEEMGSITTQAYVQRTLATDILQHFGRPLFQRCAYALPIGTAQELLMAANTLTNLQVGLYLYVIGAVASTDPWLARAVASNLGAKSRAAALMNLMSNRTAVEAPRAAALSPHLVYSYVRDRYIVSCTGESDGSSLPFGGDPLPRLTAIAQRRSLAGPRLVSINLNFDHNVVHDGMDASLYVAWIGAYGNLRYTRLQVDGEAEVPAELFGTLWVTITRGNNATIDTIDEVTVAGPEMIWVNGG